MSKESSRRRGGRSPLGQLAATIEMLTGRPATPRDIEQFRRYLDLIVSWNRVHRLTGLQGEARIARELFEDSLLFLRVLPPHPIAVIDLGTGVGIPGVPLRIVRPDISLTLVESKRKCVSFLTTLCRELGLSDVKVLEGRAENVVEGADVTGAFDVVVSRAVGLRLLPAGLRFLKQDGVFLASGPPPDAGVEGNSALAQIEDIHYPEIGRKRSFVVARRKQG